VVLPTAADGCAKDLQFFFESSMGCLQAHLDRLLLERAWLDRELGMMQVLKEECIRRQVAVLYVARLCVDYLATVGHRQAAETL
jgi:hypothetical protein